MNRRVPVEAISFSRRRCRNNVRLQVRTAKTTKSLRGCERCKLSSRVRSRRSAGRRTRARSTALAALSSASAPRNTSRPDADAATGAQIQTLHGAALRFDVDNVVVRGIDLSVKPIAAADTIPISIGNPVWISCHGLDHPTSHCPANHRRRSTAFAYRLRWHRTARQESC